MNPNPPDSSPVPRRNVRRARSSAETREAVTEPSGEAKAEGRRGANRRSNPVETQQPARPGLIRRAFADLPARARDLAVSGRDRFARAARVAGKFALVAIVLVGFGAGGRLVERYVRTSPAFAIRTVRVDGLARLQRDDVLRIGGVVLGRNIFEMPPEDVRARLERHPWIADATVRRRLPGTIDVHVRERRASAVLVVDRSYLVGEDATVFKSLEPGDPADLPVVTVSDVDRWLADRPALGTLLLDVVSLLHDYRRMGLESRGAIAEVHVEADDGLSIYVGDDAMQVRLGQGPYDTKLRRLRTLLDEMRRRNAHPAYVLLDHERRPDRVVVRLRETVVPLPPIEEPEAPAALSNPSHGTAPVRPRSSHG